MSGVRRSPEEAVLCTVAYFDAIGYAPTWVEVLAWIEWFGGTGFEQQAPPSVNILEQVCQALVQEGRIERAWGRVALPGRLEPLMAMQHERSAYVSRKIRRAASVAHWLLQNPDVRFIALANTTALGYARDMGDLDFFVIVRHGGIWSARLFGTGPYRLLGRLSGSAERRDAVCLSYFISDARLDLSPHFVASSHATSRAMDAYADPYYRYWFLSLLPLYDDGIGTELWRANAAIRALHPHATAWVTPPEWEVHAPRFRWLRVRALEPFARTFQMRWFPRGIRERMNQDTSVIVRDDALKFHVDDARVAFRDAYYERLHALGLQTYGAL
jgi:hypothetical protein